MVRLGTLLRRSQRDKEPEMEAPAQPAFLGPPLMVLIPDIAGVSSFRLYTFHDAEAATGFVLSLSRQQRERAHAFWALQDEPTGVLDGDDATGEATVLIRASEGSDLVYVVSFVDIESAQSFARFEVKRGMHLGLMLVYWASMVNVVQTEDGVQLVPEFPPRIDRRGQHTRAPETHQLRPPTEALGADAGVSPEQKNGHQASIAPDSTQAEVEAEDQRHLAAEAEAHRRIAAEAAELRDLLAEEEEKQRIAGQEEDQRRLEAEAAEQQRVDAEAAEQQRLAAEAEDARRLAAQAEEQRRFEAETEQKQVEAAAAEPRRLAAQAEERRLEAEAAEQQRAEAAAAEQRRLAADAEEQRLLAAEVEEERRRIEAAAAEQRRLGAEAAAEQQRRLEAEAEEERRVAAQAEERRRQVEAEAKDSERQRLEAEERASLEAAAEERLRQTAEAQAERERAAEAEMQRLREAMEEEQRRIDSEADVGHGDLPARDSELDRELEDAPVAMQAFQQSDEISRELSQPTEELPNPIEELLEQEALTRAQIPYEFAKDAPSDAVEPAVPDEDDASIADEVSKILRRRRWDKRESPFEGFNSPPGRF